MTRIVKPAREGQQIRRPGGRHLAPAGETVAWNSYWQRRLNDGDIVIPDPPSLPLAGGGQGGGRKSAAAPKE